MNSCASCTKAIQADPILCAGYCGLAFHSECTGISPECLIEIASGSGVLWMCGECIEFRNNGKIGLIAELESLLSKMMDGVSASLMAAFTKLREEVLSLKSPRSPRVYAEVIKASPHQLLTTHSAHRITDGSHSPAQSTTQQKPPSHYHARTSAGTLPPLSKGADTTQGIIDPILIAPNRTWLFMSRFAPSVTEDNVADMVAARLALRKDEIYVRRLVKRDADISTLHFISFKVAVPAEKRVAALSPASWPSNLAFREFQSVPRDVTAAPTTIPAAPTTFPAVPTSIPDAPTSIPAAPTSIAAAPTMIPAALETSMPNTHLSPARDSNLPGVGVSPVIAAAVVPAVASSSGTSRTTHRMPSRDAAAPCVPSVRGNARSNHRTPPESLAAPKKRTRGDHARHQSTSTLPSDSD